MNDADAALAMSAMDKKELGYFSTHSLGGALAEAGIASDMQAVRSLTWRLIKDEEYGLVDVIAAGLREAAAGDDEFVRMASAAARMVRYDLAEGPVIDALISAGKSHPDTAVSIAERLVELGDADYAGYLIGGAYGGATARCDAAIESLASSDDPAMVMASLRSLRVAHMEHGAPSAVRVVDAVDRAVRIDDDEVHCEGMAALLNIYAADRERAGPAIRELAMRRHATRPELTACILLDPPLDAAECIECLDICTDGVSSEDQEIACNTYEALAKLAGDRPDDVARLLVRLARRGAYIDDYAGLVLEELGRHHPRKAAEAVLSLLRWQRGTRLESHLPSMVEHAAKFSDPKEFAEAMLAAPGSEQDVSRRCLEVLDALSIEHPVECAGAPVPPTLEGTRNAPDGGRRRGSARPAPARELSATT